MTLPTHISSLNNRTVISFTEKGKKGGGRGKEGEENYKVKFFTFSQMCQALCNVHTPFSVLSLQQLRRQIQL